MATARRRKKGESAHTHTQRYTRSERHTRKVDEAEGKRRSGMRETHTETKRRRGKDGTHTAVQASGQESRQKGGRRDRGASKIDVE